MPQQIKTATLDGSGNGTIRLDPGPLMRAYDYQWLSVTLDTGAASLGGEARLFRGEPSTATLLTGTITPWLDTVGFVPGQARVTSPDYFAVQFLNCDPGCTATVVAQYDLIDI